MGKVKQETVTVNILRGIHFVSPITSLRQCNNRMGTRARAPTFALFWSKQSKQET